jgi:hypothetical protein
MNFALKTLLTISLKICIICNANFEGARKPYAAPQRTGGMLAFQMAVLNKPAV